MNAIISSIREWLWGTPEWCLNAELQRFGVFTNFNKIQNVFETRIYIFNMERVAVEKFKMSWAHNTKALATQRHYWCVEKIIQMEKNEMPYEFGDWDKEEVVFRNIKMSGEYRII